jgi:hypothetical protein
VYFPLPDFARAWRCVAVHANLKVGAHWVAYSGFKPLFVHRELVAKSQLLVDPWLKRFAYVWVSDDNIDYHATDASAFVRLFRKSGAAIGQPVNQKKTLDVCQVYKNVSIRLLSKRSFNKVFIWRHHFFILCSISRPSSTAFGRISRGRGWTAASCFAPCGEMRSRARR